LEVEEVTQDGSVNENRSAKLLQQTVSERRLVKEAVAVFSPTLLNNLIVMFI
jgi:hypothetical protein